MKVILEANISCTAVPRGIPNYIKYLYRQLLIRSNNEYGFSIFDTSNERIGRMFIQNHFNGYGAFNIYECGNVSYSSLLDGDKRLYEHNTYEDFIGTEADLFHFPQACPIPSRLKGKMIVTIHDMIPIVYPEHCLDKKYLEDFKRGLAEIMRIKPLVIADSNATKNDILNYTDLNPDDIYVVYAAHDSNSCFPEKNDLILGQMGIKGPFMLYLAAFDARKGIDTILCAFYKVHDAFPDINLVFAGEGLTPDLLTGGKENSSFWKHVFFMGYVTDEQKRALMSGAELFLFPSKCEGFGLPILEAMACGCPVITSNVTSIPEVAGDAAILLIDPYSVDELAFQTDRALNSDSLRKEMRENGLAQASKFSWEKTAEQVEEIFRLAVL